MNMQPGDGGHSPGEPDPRSIRTHSDLTQALQYLRSRSRHTISTLSKQTGRARSTIHDWLSGTHIPYQRERDDVIALLSALGIDDAEPWMAAFARCRDNQGDSTDRNPYMGLLPYGTDDADRFVGRDAIVEQLIRLHALTEASGPIVVMGASGAGKTSVLLAGFCPELKNRGLPVVQSTPAKGLDDLLQTAADHGGDSPRPVLIVDQFEEVLGIDESAGDIVRSLEAAAATCDVVIGVRSDFFHAAAEYDWLQTGINQRLLLVTPPSRAEITEIVSEPARQAGISVEPQAITRLVGDFTDRNASDPGASALPLLSFVLFTMVDNSDGTTMGVDLYERLGGIETALENTAEEAYSSLSPDGKRLCEQLFKSLVQLRDDAVPTRRTLHLGDYEDAHEGDDFSEVLDACIQRRILTLHLDKVTISHEALITAWPRFRRWVDEARDELEHERQLRAATSVWLSSGEDPHALLRGERLQNAASLMQGASSGQFEPSTYRFVQRSVEHDALQQTARRKRTRRISALAVVATFAAVLASGFAVRATQASNRAEIASAEAASRQLSLEASVLREKDIALSNHFAAMAFLTYPTLQARSVLVDASANPPSSRLLGKSGSTALAVTPDGNIAAYSDSVDGTITVLARDGGIFRRSYTLQPDDTEADIYALALSPDGRWLASGGTDRYVSLWDLEGDRTGRYVDDSKTQFELPIQHLTFDADGTTLYGAGTGTDAGGVGMWEIGLDPYRESELLPVPGSTTSLVLFADERFAATSNWDGTVAVWELHSRSEVWSTPSVEGTVATSVAVSPDGATLAAGYRNGTVRMWDVSDPLSIQELSITLDGFSSWINSVAFSPSGHRLAVGSTDSQLVIWGTENWNRLAEIPVPTTVTQVRFADDDLLLAALSDGSFRTIDLDHVSLQPLDGAVWAVSATDEGTLIASTRSRIARWSEFGADRIDDLLPAGETIVFSGAHAVSPDGRWLAAGTREGLVHLFDLSLQNPEPRVLDGFLEFARDIAEEENGDRDDSLSVLIEDLAFDRMSQKLAAVGGATLTYVWEINDDADEYARIRVDGLPRGVDFSSRDDLLSVTGDSTTVVFFDVSGSRPVELSEVSTGDSIGYSASFHPDDSIVVTTNADRSVMVWDIADPSSPEHITSLSGPRSRAFYATFSDDGNLLAVPVGDGSVWVWDTSSPRSPELQEMLTIPASSVYGVAFSKDGRLLAAGGADERVFVWDLHPDDIVNELCGTSGDLITEDEWVQSIPDRPYAPPCGEVNEAVDPQDVTSDTDPST